MASVTEGLLVTDSEGLIQLANPAAAAMIGKSPEAMTGKKLAETVAGDEADSVAGFLRQMEAIGSARLEMRHERADGTTIEMDWRGTRLADGGGRSALVVLTDVSDARRAEQRQAILSRKVLLAQEEERARLSRDLHDELGQILTALRLEMGVIRKKMLFTVGDPDPMFRESSVLVEKAADELRRICKGLRPPLLDDLGVEPAVELLAQEFRDRTGIAIDLSIDIGEDVILTQEVALCAYRVLQEALTNVRKHSGAKSVWVSMQAGPTEFVLAVRDDGGGFDMAGPRASEGSGLEGMRERANLVSGNMEIESLRGQGTRVCLKIPLGHREIKEVS